MLEGHGKLSSHLGVATVAELSLPFRQQSFGSLRFVNRMARGADHISGGVARPLDIGAAKSLIVTRETSVEDLLRLHYGESTN